MSPIIMPYRGIWPKIDPTAFVAPGAVVIGDVEIGAGSSIWFGCVVRGDVNKIRIGQRTNIQDGTVIHVASGDQPARFSPREGQGEGGTTKNTWDARLRGHDNGGIDQSSSNERVTPAKAGVPFVQNSVAEPKTWTGYPTLIGDGVTVGHMALLHACVVESGGFVGMKAAVMDGAVIEGQGMLAAGAVLTPGKRVGRGQLWAGTPARFWRDLSLDDIAQFDLRARQYADLAGEYGGNG